VALNQIIGSGLNNSAIPSGSVIQIQYTQFTGVNSYSMSANTDTVLTDLTVNITPISTSSIIMLDGHWFGEHSVSDPNNWNHMFFFYRDTTKLGSPGAGSKLAGITIANNPHESHDDDSTPEAATLKYFDSPSSTSQITYKVGCITKNSQTLFINRTVGDTDSTDYERGISYISATEIAG